MRIWIAIPAYTGTIYLATMRSLLTDFLELARRGDKVTVYDESGSGIIADCRSEIVSKFLESDAETLVFVDSDVAWEKGKLVQLIDYPVDFAAGVYPQRKEPIEYSVRWDQSKKELWAVDGLLEVEAVPFGFVKLTRSMLEKMVEHYSDLNYIHRKGKACALFDPYWKDGYKFGEDFSFCMRWKDMGGKIWIDPEVSMAHMGVKTYTGHIGDHLRNEIH